MNDLKKIKLILITVLITFSVCSCGVKLSGANRMPVKKHSESFFIGDGVSQYHIKPQELISDFNPKLDNNFDLTFRKNIDTAETITLNFTVLCDFNIDETSKLSINSSAKEITDKAVSVIYIEKNDNLSRNRVTATIDYKEFLKVISANDFSFKFTTNDKTITLKPNSKTLKNMTKLKASFLN